MAHLLSTPELATELQVCERTVKNLVLSGTIPRVKVGALVRFDLPEVIEALKSSTQPITNEKTPND